MTRKEIIKAYENAKDGLRDAIYEHIREFLKKNNKDLFLFSEHPAWDEFQNCVGTVTITYDGGRHPEYATNAFSEVYGVGVDKEGRLYVTCDDSDKYDLCRVWSADELIAIDEMIEFFEDYDPFDTLRQLVEERGNQVILDDSVTLDSVYNEEDNIIVTELVINENLGEDIYLNTQFGLINIKAITDYDDIYTLEDVVADQKID